MKIVIVLLSLTFLLPSVAMAGRLEKGQQAYDRNDCETARKLLRPMADKGNPQSQVIIGTLYEHGCGEPRDYVQAYRWYRKAADQGNAEAQFHVSSLYFWGWGVNKSAADSLEWVRKAADGGYAPAMIQIGLHYEQDCCGVSQDYTEAMKWFRRAADHGSAEGEFQIGYMYNNGLGVNKDCAEALKWDRKAAEQGYGNAQAQIGYHYAAGSCGLKQDYSEAYFWHSLPGAQHSTMGAAENDASHLTPEQIEAEKKRLKEWHPIPTAERQHRKPDAN